MSWTALLLGSALLAAAAGGPSSPESGESIEVRVRGRIRGGLMAIGGETTGITIRARNVTWELDFAGNDALRAQAEALDGKMAVVTGTLEGRPGVEIAMRHLVKVETIAAAGDVAPSTAPAARPKK